MGLRVATCRVFLADLWEDTAVLTAILVRAVLVVVAFENSVSSSLDVINVWLLKNGTPKNGEPYFRWGKKPSALLLLKYAYCTQISATYVR